MCTATSKEWYLMFLPNPTTSHTEDNISVFCLIDFEFFSRNTLDHYWCIMKKYCKIVWRTLILHKFRDKKIQMHGKKSGVTFGLFLLIQPHFVIKIVCLYFAKWVLKFFKACVGLILMIYKKHFEKGMIFQTLRLTEI